MTRVFVRQFAAAAIACALAPHAAGATAGSASEAAQARIEDCVARAAQHHHVHPAVLRAILKLESNLNPLAVGRNADGSVDLGIGQINSRHFALLARHGIQRAHLMDGCIGAYVAAWHLSTLIASHGNSWATIARYHSATPSLNHRYQVLLANELVSAGAIVGGRQPVPPARPSAQRPRHGPSISGETVPAMVFDDAATSDLP